MLRDEYFKIVNQHSIDNNELYRLKGINTGLNETLKKMLETNEAQGIKQKVFSGYHPEKDFNAYAQEQKNGYLILFYRGFVNMSAIATALLADRIHLQTHGEIELPYFSMDQSHAEYINQLGGDWMQGVVDPYGGTQAGQSDGKSMVQRYKEAGLRIKAADRSYKQNGIIMILEMMREGRLKVFDDLAGWLSEFRMYAYDDKGKPKDKNDHFMDTMRYGVESGMKVAKSKRGIARRFWDDFTTDKGSWETV